MSPEKFTAGCAFSNVKESSPTLACQEEKEGKTHRARVINHFNGPAFARRLHFPLIKRLGGSPEGWTHTSEINQTQDGISIIIISPSFPGLEIHLRRNLSGMMPDSLTFTPYSPQSQFNLTDADHFAPSQCNSDGRSTDIPGMCTPAHTKYSSKCCFLCNYLICIVHKNPTPPTLLFCLSLINVKCALFCLRTTKGEVKLLVRVRVDLMSRWRPVISGKSGVEGRRPLLSLT